MDTALREKSIMIMNNRNNSTEICVRTIYPKMTFGFWMSDMYLVGTLCLLPYLYLMNSEEFFNSHIILKRCIFLFFKS